MAPAHSEPELRASLDAVPRYRAGAAPPPGPAGVVAYKVASNENPYPPLPGVLAAISDAATGINRYPDFGSTQLVAELARTLGVNPDQLALGTGSVSLLEYAAQITCADNDEVVFAWPSFEAYPIVTAVAGAQAVQVPLTSDHHHDLEAMLAAITAQTRLVIVCSPNNPTGTAVERSALVDFLKKVPSRILVVLDEAYTEFVSDDASFDSLALMSQFPNVCILRTFSKAYGLAAIRLGYAIASENVASALRAVALPFGISSVAQAAGLAALAPPAQRELQARIAQLNLERERVVTALGALCAANPEGNFVWLPLGERSAEFANLCQEQALSVRLFVGVGVRVTIAEPQANDRLITIAQGFSDDHASA